MTQTEILDKFKGQTLAWINCGPSKIDLEKGNVEVFLKATNHFSSFTAEVVLYFQDSGGKEVVPVLISCHCLRNPKWFFKLRIDELLKTSLINHDFTLNIQGMVSEFKLYETDSIDNSLNYDTNQYLSDAMLIHFHDQMILSLVSIMGSDEHEPCIWLKYFNPEKVDTEQELRTINWIVREVV